MRSNLALIIGFFFLFLGHSCSSINKSHLNGAINIKVDSPMAAKIDVDMTKKITGYASGGYLFHLFRVSGDNKFVDGIYYDASGAPDGFFSSMFEAISKTSQVRSAAAYNAIRTSDADVIINPQYVIEENSWNPFYKLIKVKVTGYPGRIVSIKNTL